MGREALGSFAACRLRTLAENASAPADFSEIVRTVGNLQSESGRRVASPCNRVSAARMRRVHCDRSHRFGVTQTSTPAPPSRKVALCCGRISAGAAVADLAAGASCRVTLCQPSALLCVACWLLVLLLYSLVSTVICVY